MYFIIFFIVLLLLAVPLGRYIASVFSGQQPLFMRWLRPVERIIYRLCGIDEGEEMTWKQYAGSFCILTLFGIAFLFILERIQGGLPFNPQHLGAVRWDTALNTAISFATNTNWQSYGGETTMAYFTQMLGLTTPNFVSAAAGIASCIAFLRGFMRKSCSTIGNFWVDVTRSILYILLPLSIICSVVLVSQGVVQTFRGYPRVQTMEGESQVIAVGPAASQVAIKQLGSNGGGFFNANSSHPFENPTPFSGFVELLAILLIPAAMPFAFGALTNRRRAGWVFFCSMALLFCVGFLIAASAEHRGNPLFTGAGIAGNANMEGKEVRFGVTESVLWGQATTVTSNGSVNAMHDSFLPGTSIPLIFNMAIGEVIFGGVGVGLIGIFFYAILTMFLCGLMIGRTPELLGKKLEPLEMVMAVIALIGPCVFLLIMIAVGVASPLGLASRGNLGPHGFTEIVYACASAMGNNGSAFAGLSANTIFYNLLTGFGMLAGRFLTILPALFIAGSLARKRTFPTSSATFPVENPLFIVILCGVIVIVGALTFFPVLVIGPFLEHLQLMSGIMF
ncbi:MAG: potassium-transporting ATPase subunit KdpA [Candidatus Ratteibacteria bacterium]|jgi:K+-transporting ATPase ATPase A chain